MESQLVSCSIAGKFGGLDTDRSGHVRPKLCALPSSGDIEHSISGRCDARQDAARIPGADCERSSRRAVGSPERHVREVAKSVVRLRGYLHVGIGSCDTQSSRASATLREHCFRPNLRSYGFLKMLCPPIRRQRSANSASIWIHSKVKSAPAVRIEQRDGTLRYGAHPSRPLRIYAAYERQLACGAEYPFCALWCPGSVPGSM